MVFSVGLCPQSRHFFNFGDLLILWAKDFNLLTDSIPPKAHNGYIRRHYTEAIAGVQATTLTNFVRSKKKRTNIYKGVVFRHDETSKNDKSMLGDSKIGRD